MQLECLELEAFGCFRGRRFAFRPGFNLIVGLNGAGKSTLSAAILECLFARSTQRKSMARWQSWERQQGPSARLQLRSAQQERICITRDWGTGKATLQVDDERLESRESRFSALLQTKFGPLLEDAFAGTVFVAQDQMESELWDAAKLAHAIEQLALTGNQVRVQEVLRRLKSARGQLRRSAQAKVPGPIAVLSQSLVEAARERELYRARKQQYDQAQDRLRAVSRQLRAMRPEREALASELARVQEARGLQDRLAAAQAQRDEINEDRRFYHEQEEAIAQIEARARHLPAKPAVPSFPARFPSRALLGIGMALIVAGALLGSMNANATALYVVGGLAALIGLGAWMWRHARRQNPPPTSPPQAGAEAQTAIEHRRALQRARLGEGVTMADLSLRSEDLHSEIARLSEALDTSAMRAVLAMDPRDEQSQRQRHAALTQDIQASEAQRQELRGAINALQDSASVALAADERLYDLQRQRDQLVERAEVLHLTHEALAAARAQALQTASQRLAPGIGAALSQLTAGRYVAVRLDADLTLTVRDDVHPQGWIPVEALSAGTQDQVYFAVRLALTDLLFPDRCPPLLLDDPFVKFDAPRRQAATETLRRLARHRQVLLFSHSPEYKPAADHVIDLSAVLESAGAA